MKCFICGGEMELGTINPAVWHCPECRVADCETDFDEPKQGIFDFIRGLFDFTRRQ